MCVFSNRFFRPFHADLDQVICESDPVSFFKDGAEIGSA